MNEEFKNLTFYRAPPVEKPLALPPAPPTKKETFNFFIPNPKSLPTDLSKFERPRQYHERLMQLDTIEYVAPRIVPVKPSQNKLKSFIYSLKGKKPDPRGIERHVFQTTGTRLTKLSDMPRPLTLCRKEVPDYSKLAELEKAAENEAGSSALTAAELEKISPAGGAARNKKFMFKKKTRQIYEYDMGAKLLRQREALPWVLESHGTETPKEELRGTLEGGSTSRYVAFVFRKGGFYVRPIKRIYTFRPRPTYHVPTAEETEELLNAKKKINMDKWFQLNKRLEIDDKPKDSSKSSFKVLDDEEDNDDEDQPRTKRGDDIDELDFDEDFQDDEEMGLETVHDDAKENEEQLKKKQNRLNPVSSDSDTDDEKAKPDLNDPSVRKLKRMVGDDDDLDSDSDSDAPAVAIKRMELPPVPAKNDKNPKVDSKSIVKPSAKPPIKSNSSKLDTKSSKKQGPSSPRSQKRAPSPRPDPKDRPSKHVKTETKPETKPSQSTSGSSSLPTPEKVVQTVKNNPGITMKDLVQNLGLKTLKVNAEQRKQIIDMLHQVVYKPKNSEALKIHAKYL